MNKLILKLAFISGIVFLSSCTSETGYEFMPNMYRSPSIETYAEHNISGYDGIPVEGTIARGYLSTFNYDGTLDGYLLAGKNAVNPLENNTENDFFKNRVNKTKMVNNRSKFNQFTFHLSNPLTIFFRNIFLKILVKNKKFLESYLGKIYKN